MRRGPGAAALAAALLLPGAASSASRGDVRVGVLPAQDLSGTPHGVTLSHSLGATLFAELSGLPLEPVFLNPGPFYTPLEPDSYLELAREERLDVVLLTSLSEAGRDNPELTLKALLVEVATGRQSSAFAVAGKLRRGDVLRAIYFDGAAFFGPSRQFDKQPLGKLGKELAKGVALRTVGTLRAMGVAGTAPGPPDDPGECEVLLRVRYGETAISKSYDLIVNGREESLGIQNGVARLRLKSGPFVLHASVKDKPYRLKVQEVYSFNGYVDCRRSERSLALLIGQGGDARFRWE